MSFQITQALAHFLWQGLAIAAILFILLSFLREASHRYNACAGALALMCAAPVATFFYLAPQAAPLGGTRGIVLETALASSAVLRASWFEANATRLFWLWLAGALFLLIRTSIAWWRARRVVTKGFEPLAGAMEVAAGRLAVQLGAKRVQFRVSARVASTLVFGWLKPIIVLPAAALGRLSGAEIEALLAHELAHVMRGDFLVNLLQTVAECILFYHPLVWWVSARMREEREVCCDDIAVAVCRDEVLYSKALLQLEEIRMEPALAATGGRLALRIRRLLAGPESSRIAVAPAVAFVLVFGISVALLAQSSQPATTAPRQTRAGVSASERAVLPMLPGTANAGRVYRVGDGVSMPIPISTKSPEYTEEARASQLEGAVLLALVVSEDGTARDFKLVRGLDKGLDEKAIESVRQWRFEPGRKDGKPVPVSAYVEVNFWLSGQPPYAPVPPVPPEPSEAPSEADTPPAPSTPGAPPAPAPWGVPAPRIAPVPAVAPLPPAPPNRPNAGNVPPAPPAPPVPPANGVARREVDGVAVEMRAAADAERAALERERRETARERQAAAEERAEAAKARKEAETALREDMAKARANAANDPESQKSIEVLQRKVVTLAGIEAQKARAESDKARHEMNIAAREVEIAQTVLQQTAREADIARTDADRLRPQAEVKYESKTNPLTKEAELKRRRAYAADRFGGENTDRGKAYLHYGPPDEMESHSSSEIWRYRDEARTHFTLELEFQDGKQVRSSGKAAIARADTDGMRSRVEVISKSKAKAPTEAAELERRRAYVTELFGGENTDRGKTYMHYGPPDEIESHPSMGKGMEIWRYKDATKKNVNLEIEFQDGKQVRSSGEAAAPNPK